MRIIVPLLMLACEPAVSPQQAPPIALQIWVADPIPGLRTPIAITGATPGADVYLFGSGRGGQGRSCEPSGVVCSSLEDALPLGPEPADDQGTATFRLRSRADLGGAKAFFQGATAEDGWSPIATRSVVIVRGPDSDGDGLIDGRERQLRLDPTVADMDADGLLDGEDPLPRVPGPQPPLVDDLLVSHPDLPIADIELDPLADRLVWQSLTGDAMWLAWIDPVRGLMTPAHGRGQLLDTHLTRATDVTNGPEWVVRGFSSEIVYGKVDRGVTSLWRAAVLGGSWRTQQLEDTEGFTFPYGTRHPGDTDPWLRFSYTDPLSGEARTGMRRYLDPASTVLLDRAMPWARWVDDDHLLVGTEGVQGITQVRALDPATNTATNWTWDPTWKHIPRTIRAPEWNDELALVVLRGESPGHPTGVGIYRDFGAGYYEEHRTVWGPPAYPFVHAPELFTWNGRSYVVYEAHATPPEQTDGPNQIWIASLEGGAGVVWRRICDGAPAKRRDPEAYTRGARPWIFYALKQPGNGDSAQLRRCETGL